MNDSSAKDEDERVGLVLGKMMPPHLGHLYLIEFAARSCERLYVVVEHVQDEPISSALRVEWLRDIVPQNVSVLHLEDAHPQKPSEHPRFWEIWRRSLLGLLPEAPTTLFASESYGARLAEEVGAVFCPVDPGRQVMPISGTAVRADLLGSFPFLPAPVRAHFALRVSVFGPESTGKSTLSQRLAKRFETLCVPEYARTYIEALERTLLPLDLSVIVRGQIASEDALAGGANRLLFCDTDPLVTPLWSEMLFGAPMPEERSVARARQYDLTLLCSPDVPWVADGVRYLPEGGKDFFERCVAELKEAGRAFVVLEGDWAAREAEAFEAVAELLAEGITLPSWP